MEQRYRAVVQVQSGVPVTEVADAFGVSRQAVHRWLRWYRDEGLAGLADGSHRPHEHPWQVDAAVEAAICEMRRDHPRWGKRRLAFELGRQGCPGPVPSESTIYRVLVRHNFIRPVQRGRPRESYQRWERPEPMQLWQLDIVDGDHLVHGLDTKIITAVDDHSRFCVICAVVTRATGRAVCLALVAAFRRYGIPDELLTDNGKQFTARFNPGGGETMFDRICRENGITHRLTQPRTPTTTGKIERFHQTLQNDWLTDCAGFASVAEAQVALDAFVVEYNTDRPHQSLGMDFPVDRFTARPMDELGLRLPPALGGHHPAAAVPAVPALPSPRSAPEPQPPLVVSANGVDPVNLAVQIERVVPASGNLGVCGHQFWLGPGLGGVAIQLWIDTTVVHILREGVRLKSVPSRFTPAHLRQLLADGATVAGPAPTTPERATGPFEVDRLVNACGLVGLAGRQHPIGSHLAGQRVTVRVDGVVMQILDHDRTLLRTLPNPLGPDDRRRLRDGRPAGPPPHVPESAPVVERRVSCRGAIMVAGQRIQVGLGHSGLTVTVATVGDQFHIYDGDLLLVQVANTTDKPIARFKARKPEPSRVRQRPDALVVASPAHPRAVPQR